MYTCIDCKRTFSKRGLLNHLHITKEPHWYEQEQDVYKNDFESFQLNAKFIKYNNEGRIITYHCNISNLDVSCYYDKLRQNGLCQCKVCQYNHKSAASKKHWLQDNGEHGRQISKALLNNQKHREDSALRLTKLLAYTRGQVPWSKYEELIHNYLTDKGIEHKCNFIVLHLPNSTKNFIYDLYLPKYNMLIELNDRHLNSRLYSREELKDIKFKTYRDEALHDIIKKELAESKGYTFKIFFDLDECKTFIDTLT